ncbi:MAG: 7-carboxy-7-deazaguanine synthase, partial [Planctomycetes bacterium]|nr:7-carboxy-7-deazaguanine synthase [Planctomycetota bacterium]
MMRVKEIYGTLNGEGANSGRAVVICRFSGCNLWDGSEKGRHQSRCGLCDESIEGTDGPLGGEYPPQKLAEQVEACWKSCFGDWDTGRHVLFTGGEPALQLTGELIDLCKKKGFFTAIESNGTLALPPGLDWICISPKSGTELSVCRGDELKLVYPQKGLDPESLRGLDFGHFFLQPRFHPQEPENIKLSVDYCLAHPQWRLSLQIHKIV